MICQTGFRVETVETMNALLKGSEYEEKLQLQENFDGIQVIGAGLPRTGTLSTRSALAELLKGKVYHMNNLAQGEDIDYEFWKETLNGSAKTSNDWKDFLQNRGFVATLDNPAAIYYKQLHAAFPKAKVLLTIRDPESWYESVKNSIHISNQLSNSFPLTLYTRYMGKYDIMKLITQSAYVPMVKNGQSMFGAIEAGREASIQFYNDWVQEVKESIPADQLLIFSVKEGWDPLCQFLKVPVPEVPFPKVNDTVSLNEFNQKMFMVKYLVNFVLIPTAVSAVMMYLYLN